MSCIRSCWSFCSMMLSRSSSMGTCNALASRYRVSPEHFSICVLPLHRSLKVAWGTPLSFCTRYFVIPVWLKISLMFIIITVFIISAYRPGVKKNNMSVCRQNCSGPSDRYSLFIVPQFFARSSVHIRKGFNCFMSIVRWCAAVRCSTARRYSLLI